MKFYYLICQTTPREENDEIMNANIAGRYDSMEKLQENRKNDIEQWAKQHDLKNCPVYVYTGETII